LGHINFSNMGMFWPTQRISMILAQLSGRAQLHFLLTEPPLPIRVQPMACMSNTSMSRKEFCATLPVERALPDAIATQH
jgi:hypothetical protein